MTRRSIRFILAMIVILMGSLIVASLIFVPIPAGNGEPLMLALGLVLGWGSLSLSFYFGTSESSAQKTKLLAGRANDEEEETL